MKVAFDTSVIVPAVLSEHPFHGVVRPWFIASRKGRVKGCAALHAAAECWSVLTRVALPERVPPAIAQTVVSRLFDTLECMAPTRAIYDRAISLCVEAGVRSGAVFDALHVASAEAAGCDTLLTLNERDFDRFVTAKVTIGSPARLRVDEGGP